ncbi:hypothetical protein BDW02DRAFT_615400 [Decorospora gaudefroyi]|uniref:Gfd2/YDR514C-like C-terminal domain-containing protein n=1 Tax=Decorospora gaudefroyi TaxID=184978 RepID=A0A6A5JVT0_9PLEO|nr:hypothetical protein BDW02DRAFT_615400 [Decorospora gaudefroyi]
MPESEVYGSVSPATGGSSSPLPSELEQLTTMLSSKSSKEVLEHYLGLNKLQAVSPVAENMIVVCFDTESWTNDHNKITEVGVSTFDSRDMRVVKEAGPYSENLLKQVYFYHARILENAHLLNIKYCVGNPDTQVISPSSQPTSADRMISNRFGQTRFLTRPEACGMLTEMIAWPIDERQPELGFCPVVVMGHALNGDISMLKNTLGFNSASLGSVVKCGYAARSHNQIGLRNLVGSCGFSYRDPHTASNDAAMTLICALQMILPAALKPSSTPLQRVVDEVELASRAQKWTWGNDMYCLRCGEYGHTKNNFRGRRCSKKICCMHCRNAKVEKRIKAASTHRTECCITYARSGGSVLSSTVADWMLGVEGLEVVKLKPGEWW